MWLSGFKQQIVFQLAGRRTNPFEMAKPLPSPLAEGEPTGSQTTQQLRTQLVFIGRGVQAHRKEICEKLTACQVRISASVDAVCGGHRCCASYETAANGAKLTGQSFCGPQVGFTTNQLVCCRFALATNRALTFGPTSIVPQTVEPTLVGAITGVVHPRVYQDT